MALVVRRFSSTLGGGWRLAGRLRARPQLMGASHRGLPRPAEARRVPMDTSVNSVLALRCISSTGARKASEKVNMTFVEDDGTEVKVEAELGTTLLEVAHESDVELEGACGGDLACSTCHVVLPKDYYDKLDEKEEEEDDMLDLAWGLTDTSRLGCQIKVTRDLEGMLIKIPEDSMDMS
ncbi:unnamed protein product [Scytosiphon promiscuus]